MLLILEFQASSFSISAAFTVLWYSCTHSDVTHCPHSHNDVITRPVALNLHRIAYHMVKFLSCNMQVRYIT